MSQLRILISFVFLVLIFFAFPQQEPVHNQKQSYLLLYIEADRLYHEAEKDIPEEKEIRINKLTLKSFRDLMQLMEEENAVNDSLAFHIYFKIGVLEHYFENFTEAQKAYKLSLEKASLVPSLPDSMIFKPYLYLGIVLYNEMKFDSAIAVYKKAEVIADKYGSSLTETERLYNTLGTMYYETGNYRQAKNYLSKSIALLPRQHPSYRELMVNYKINLASILTKLEEYDEALNIYESLVPFQINKDIILHNTGVIYLNLDSVVKAISYFRRANPSKTNRARLYNDMAIGFYTLHQYDSSIHYLDMAKAAKSNATRKSFVYGQTLKISGDVLLAQKKIPEAIDKYQQAIIQFYSDFNDTNIYHDPLNYSGLFSYINLFNALTAKADAFEILSRHVKKIEMLKASLNTYHSAFLLADYVEKSYDSDEARLFLNKVKYLVHSRPIDISLALYELTKEQAYLEDAYLFDQRNKGSVISLGIQENELKRNAGINNELSRQELFLRSAITRLSFKSSQSQDSVSLNEFNASIRDYEIQLSKIQEKISHSPGVGKPIERIPSVKDLQGQFDKNTAFLSYHLSQTHLVILCITKRTFSYEKIAISDSFFSGVKSFIVSLPKMHGNDRNDLSASALKLYQWLIRPVYNKIKHAERLIVIPDDELNYLPFETLKDENGNYLLRKFSIQYQYAASLLSNHRPVYKGYEVLAMAPFSSSSFSSDSLIQFKKLAHSREEISGFPGEILLDSQATKTNFMKKANKFPIIHLATHAVVNDTNPLNSFIAFYPSVKNADSTDYRLYAGEIYNLKLDSTSLVILSACETGAGELVRGEGLMSLTRAFAYAGCSNIVTSLWKAEDRTTAFITKQMYHYLRMGNPTDIALQKAKLDLLSSTEIDPVLKSPSYWGHLLFIGNYEPRKENSPWIWIISVAGLGIIVSTFLLYRKRKAPHS